MENSILVLADTGNTLCYHVYATIQHCAVFHPDILARGGKMVHAINGGGEGGATCHAVVRSMAVAWGVRGHAPPNF